MSCRRYERRRWSYRPLVLPKLFGRLMNLPRLLRAELIPLREKARLVKSTCQGGVAQLGVKYA